MRKPKQPLRRGKLKRWLTWVFALCAMLVLIGVLAGFAIYANARLLRTDAGTYRLRVANSAAERELGLSGVATMSDSKGMLFVFDKPDTACFWMKDMQFGLDMIWLNSDKQVIAVASDVLPRSYPRAYCPPSNATYVIELVAGQAEVAGIAVGKTLSF